MNIYDNIVAQLQNSKGAVPKEPMTVYPFKSSHPRAEVLFTRTEKNASPTIDEILAELQTNIKGTTEIFSQIDGYLPSLKEEKESILRETPRVEVNQAIDAQSEYLDDDALTNSVVRMPVSPETNQPHVETDNSKNEEFNRQLSQAMINVRQEPSKMLSYIKEKDELPRKPVRAPDPDPFVDAEKVSEDILKQMNKTEEALEKDLRSSKQTTVIVPPRLAFEEEHKSRQCVIMPFELNEQAAQQETHHLKFSADNEPIDMAAVVEAARALLLSTDPMFQELKSLNSSKLGLINSIYPEISREPRLTRLMWKFFGEQNMTFRVKHFDAVLLFKEMVSVLAGNFSKYGGVFSDFLSCQLEMDYDLVGICVLVLISRS